MCQNALACHLQLSIVLNNKWNVEAEIVGKNDIFVLYTKKKKRFRFTDCRRVTQDEIFLFPTTTTTTTTSAYIRALSDVIQLKEHWEYLSVYNRNFLIY